MKWNCSISWTHWGFIAVVLVGIFFAVVWGLQRTTPQTLIPAPLVKTVVVHFSGNDSGYSYSGEVRGRYESRLAFQVSGKIVRRDIELGSRVQPGMVLMAIDPKDVKQIVSAGEAQILAAQSQVRLTGDHLQRYRQLYEENAISKAEYVSRESAYETAKAQALQATSQHAQSSNQLEYCLLQSDIPGVIASIDAEVGQVISSGQTIVTVVQDGDREVEINIPESRVEEIKQARGIAVQFWALPQIKIAGVVREIAPAADKVTRTYKVRILLQQPPEQMQLGMTATVNIAALSGEQAVARIPLTALYQTGDTPSVWVVEQGMVRLRPVRVQSFGKNEVLVTGGLAEGEVIVIAGVHKLQTGQAVRVGEEPL